MTPAIALLVHKNLDRVAQVARFLSDAGLHVCIHVDGSISANRFNDFKHSLSDLEDILWAKRIECEWGHFSLVDATLNVSDEILKKWDDIGHVLLLSGDCLPVRPDRLLYSSSQ